ncbi:MAG: hypothetical protein LWX56_14690 [Ignavibacteria bacterium]|nr:hypothetical protein [Ignavibacteria bacterium]
MCDPIVTVFGNSEVSLKKVDKIPCQRGNLYFLVVTKRLLLKKISILINCTDTNYKCALEGAVPQEISGEDNTLTEQVKLIQELEPDEKNMVFQMVDTFLTKIKFKDFFQKNVAMLNKEVQTCRAFLII